MARIDDVLSLAQAKAGTFRDTILSAEALSTELHAQGWDTALPPAAIIGSNLDIEPNTGQELAIRQAAVAARMGLGLAAFTVLKAILDKPPVPPEDFTGWPQGFTWPDEVSLLDALIKMAR
jgi:hypothetical protein